MDPVLQGGRFASPFGEKVECSEEMGVLKLFENVVFIMYGKER